ncbi:MAG TPA: cupin [Chitinophagaceae bacterium]|nr:cupin [Chitinophagaceae bacterium]
MDRKTFISTLMIFPSMRFFSKEPIPEKHFFKDDGLVPNNKLPLLWYRNVFDARDEKGASWLEERFYANNWKNSWRNGIFTFQHYHSIAHEVLGIYSGKAKVLLGGDKGAVVEVKAGDIIVIPAGVGHKNLGDENLGVVGAYPNGMDVDILRAQPGDRPQADRNIAAVPLPASDPLLGNGKGLIDYWK